MVIGPKLLRALGKHAKRALEGGGGGLAHTFQRRTAGFVFHTECTSFVEVDDLGI